MTSCALTDTASFVNEMSFVSTPLRRLLTAPTIGPTREAVTMRRVGRELGVEAMSLYNHGRDKDDLLQAIRGHVLSQFEDPGMEGPWEERARRAARSWRQVLRAHPDMLRLISEEKIPDLSPDSIRPNEVALRMIREVGLSDAD